MVTEMQIAMVKWELRQSMGEELTPSSVYHIRALRARDAGFEEVAKAYEDVAADEDDHYAIFYEQFKKLGGPIIAAPAPTR